MSEAYRIIEYPIPLAAVSVLKRIQNGGVPEALVAGGCLRDTINGKPVNDIDVFVPEDKWTRAALAIKETHPRCVKDIPEPYFTFNHDVRLVRYYDAVGNWPQVNIIGVTRGTCTPEKQLERFDFGICRVAFDGVRLWKDLAFDRDQQDQTFTLLVDQTKEQRVYSLGRYGRLTALKYPGWKLVDTRLQPPWYDDCGL